jgi:hypothetical protein
VSKYEKYRNDLTITLNDTHYDVYGSFDEPGTFKVYSSALTMGLLKLVAFRNSDFTSQMFETYINWVNIGMNSTFNDNFIKKTMYYSMKISGYLSCITSDTYEIYLETNKRAIMFMDGVKVLTKSQDVNSKRFIRDLFNDRFYDFEIRIIVDERIPEPEGTLPYVKLRWKSQNFELRDIKPRNFYYLNPFDDNGGHILTVV